MRALSLSILLFASCHGGDDGEAADEQPHSLLEPATDRADAESEEELRGEEHPERGQRCAHELTDLVRLETGANRGLPGVFPPRGVAATCGVGAQQPPQWAQTDQNDRVSTCSSLPSVRVFLHSDR